MHEAITAAQKKSEIRSAKIKEMSFLLYKIHSFIYFAY